MRAQTTVLILLCLLVVGLLAGRAFGLSWAGGPGYVAERHASLTVLTGEAALDDAGTSVVAHAGMRIRRGEILRTGPDAFALIQIGGTAIGLAGSSDLRIDSLVPGDLRVTLTRGRLMTDAHEPLRILTVPADTNTLADGGGLSVVHYDFREAVSILPVGKAVSTVFEGTSIHGSDKPYEYSALPPRGLIQSDEPFRASASTAAAFYAWFASVTDFRFE